MSKETTVKPKTNLKREIKLWLITKLVLWIIALIPSGCVELKLWVLKFPHKEFENY